MRTPSHRFDRSPMLPEAPGWSILRSVPNEHFVVITPAGQLIGVKIPFETTDFLLVMTGEFADILFFDSGVAVKD
jgi:hypothetical protein